MNPEIVTLTRNGDGGWSLVVSPVRDEPRIEAPRFARGGILWNVEADAAPVADTSGSKYELVPEGDLFRLRATRSFYNHWVGVRVNAADLGGLVSSGDNLSQDGDCWITQNAQVTGRVLVREDAVVYGRAQVSGMGQIFGHASVSGNADVSGSFEINGYSAVYDSAQLSGNFVVSGNAQVSGDARVGDGVSLAGTVSVGDTANLSGRGVHASYGQFGGQMRVRAMSDFLTLVTRWGPLTLAKSARTEGYEFRAGCQSPDTIEELREALESNDGGDFERQVLAGYAEMVRAALVWWGISVEV